MLELLVKIMPLFLASTVSPGIFAIVIFLLSQKKSGFVKTSVLLLGSIVASILIVMAGYYLGHITIDPDNTHIVDNVLNIVLGIILLCLGIREMLVKDNHGQSHKVVNDASINIFKWFAVGFLISITNFDSVVFIFTATKEIAQSQIDKISRTVLVMIGLFFFNLPIILPIFLYAMSPNTAKKILQPINAFLVKYGRYIVAVIFVVFALYLLFKGIRTF